MDSAEAAATSVCFQCGGSVTAAQGSCHYCGMPVLPELVGAAPARAVSTSDSPERTVAPVASTVSLPQQTLTLGGEAPQRGIGRKPVLIAVAAVGALVLLATGIAVVSRLVAETPRSTVEAYFDALGDGDAAGALKLVYRAAEIDPSRYPLLTAAGLADRDARPRDVKVGDAKEAVGRYDEGTSTVDVTYHAGGTTVEQTILVTEAADGDGYHLYGPFVQVELRNTLSRAVTVNGVALSDDTQDEVVAFPGAFKAEAAASALFAGASVTAPPAGTRLKYTAVLDFGTPQLAPGVQERIDSSVRSAIDQCAASTAASPSGCPFRADIYAWNVSVRWSVTRYPAISVDTATIGLLGNDDQVSISDDGSGSVHWTATYSDFSGVQQTKSGDTAIHIRGTAQASGSDIRVTLN
ncbi:hypothetical protein [Micromonospora sp. NPDC049274]|uniref:hypothetical protein n=1 Tax=Micromonospora sp. NPDC049274 TaxID=3154829 RepID=UPI00341CEFED